MSLTMCTVTVTGDYTQSSDLKTPFRQYVLFSALATASSSGLKTRAPKWPRDHSPWSPGPSPSPGAGEVSAAASSNRAGGSDAGVGGEAPSGGREWWPPRKSSDSGARPAPRAAARAAPRAVVCEARAQGDPDGGSWVDGIDEGRESRDEGAHAARPGTLARLPGESHLHVIRSQHGDAEEVRLELHQRVVAGGAPVDTEEREGGAVVKLHGFQHLFSQPNKFAKARKEAELKRVGRG